MDFTTFVNSRLSGADVVYWRPFPDEPYAVCVIRLNNEFIVCGDSSWDMDAFLDDDYPEDELYRSAYSHAESRLDKALRASYFEEVISPQIEHHATPDTLQHHHASTNH